MKTNKLIVWSLLLLMLLIAVGLYVTVKPAGKKMDVLPQIFNEYNVKFLKFGAFPGGGKMVVCGFVAKNPKSKITPGSFLAIYRLEDKGRSMYRYYPLVPREVNYPRPLLLEKAAVIRKNNRSYIVSAWGETGADYFGTHPVVIAFAGGRFKTIPFYQGRLADSPKIKRLAWTRKDFRVKNYFDPSDSVQTILTQGVFITRDGRVELSFYGVKFKFSLARL